jgi:hypothetical protein
LDGELSIRFANGRYFDVRSGVLFRAADLKLSVHDPNKLCDPPNLIIPFSPQIGHQSIIARPVGADRSASCDLSEYALAKLSCPIAGWRPWDGDEDWSIGDSAHVLGRMCAGLRSWTRMRLRDTVCFEAGSQVHLRLENKQG